jgi:hypothetical protein
MESVSVKLSVNLSDEVAKRLNDFARNYTSGNASLVTDMALRRLFAIPAAELPAMFFEYTINRMANNRQGWMEAFWLALSRMMGREDGATNPYVARNFRDAYVVILRSSVGEEDAEDDPFYVHGGPGGGTTTPVPDRRWAFERVRSPVYAAREVAEWLASLPSGTT